MRRRRLPARAAAAVWPVFMIDWSLVAPLAVAVAAIAGACALYSFLGLV